MTPSQLKRNYELIVTADQINTEYAEQYVAAALFIELEDDTSLESLKAALAEAVDVLTQDQLIQLRRRIERMHIDN